MGRHGQSPAITSRASRTVCSVASFVLAATLAQNATPQTAAALSVSFPSMKYAFNIIALFFLSGCSFLSTERTPEEIAEFNNQVQVVHESVLVPVYMLARETCKYHMQNGAWPETSSTHTYGSFDHLEVVLSDSDSLKFNMKLSSVNGSANFTINKLPSAPKEAPYGYKLLAHFPGGSINAKNFFSCSGQGLTEKELMGYSKKLTSTLNFYNAIAKSNQPKEDSLARQSIELGVSVALCMLLKLEPSQCN